MGLHIYSSECKRWNKSGRQILEASQQEIDKELRIANPLHRKKLHLALEGKLPYYHMLLLQKCTESLAWRLRQKDFLAEYGAFSG